MQHQIMVTCQHGPSREVCVHDLDVYVCMHDHSPCPPFSTPLAPQSVRHDMLWVRQSLFVVCGDNATSRTYVLVIGKYTCMVRQR